MCLSETQKFVKKENQKIDAKINNAREQVVAQVVAHWTADRKVQSSTPTQNWAHFSSFSYLSIKSLNIPAFSTLSEKKKMEAKLEAQQAVNEQKSW